MPAPFSFFIGLRYTRAKRRDHFISFISLVSVLGLALGVTVMIVVLSVMNGFHKELRDRILGMVPHAQLYSSEGPISDWQPLAERLQAHPQVLGTAPFVQGEGMLANAGHVQGVLFYGVLPEREPQVSIVADHMVSGSLEALQPGEFGIVLGDLLAALLRVDIGDRVTLVVPEASVTPAGIYPRLKRFRVVGLFSLRAELDASLALMHIEDAALLARIPGQVQGVRVRVDDLFAMPQLGWQLASQLPGNYQVRDWTRSHGNLFQATQLEKRMLGLLLLMIVAVAAFNIVSSLVMLVVDKQSDIAILRTLGATPRQITGIFMVQGSVIGVVGTAIGVACGCAVALTISDLVSAFEALTGRRVLSSDVYFIDYFPSQLMLGDVATVAVAALVMSFVATLYPARRAARIEPADALRYE
ncbi:MAG: lipoprotein-releasing ABC transporter permease subunit [Pseudomonadota bacterium]|nr:lipoprotein-releasing ABC transporter permease subunit [Pseudomonadota bacterium]